MLEFLVFPLHFEGIMNLQSASLDDIPVGNPLPWDLYDNAGQIVLAKGTIVSSREELEKLGDLKRDENKARESVQHEPFPPQGIKPQIGERIQFRLLTRSSQIHYSARLIGYIAKQTILVTVPLVGASPLTLVDGEPIEVRMVTGSNIVVFSTTIQRVCISPIHYMHLDYPASIRKQNLRKSPWARVNLDAIVRTADGGREAARIVNLSTDGAQLIAPPIGHAGEAIRVAFDAELDELKTPLDLEARIMRVQGVDDAAHQTAYGIRFNNANTEHEIWLNAMIYKHISEGGLA